MASNITPENLLETKEFFRNTIKEIKGEVNPLIVNNPKFEELFYNELLYYVKKTLSTDFDIVVSDDKNIISITSYIPMADAYNGENRTFMRSVFSLKDTNLVCDYSQGVLYEKGTIEEMGVHVDTLYENKLETLYTTKYFNKEGVEYSNNSYSDMYLYNEKADDIDLRERVLSLDHKPVFSEYKLATISNHVMYANIRNTYRKEDSIAVVHSNIAKGTKEGYKDIHCTLFTCHYLTPELLRGEKMFAKSVGNAISGFKFEIANDYAESIPEAYKKAHEDFKNNIKESELKQSNPRTYNYLIEKL